MDNPKITQCKKIQKNKNVIHFQRSILLCQIRGANTHDKMAPRLTYHELPRLGQKKPKNQ